MAQEERDKLHETIAQAMLNVIDKRRAENPDLSLLWLTQPNKNAPEHFWTDVREILNRDGITRPRGRQWTEDNHLSVQYVLKSKIKEDIYGRVGRWLGIEVKEASTKKAKQDKKKAAQTKESPKSKPTQEEPNVYEAIRELSEQIKALKQTQHMQPDRPDIDEERDEPEFPKKATVPNKKVSADVNIVLFNLLEKEEKRQGGNRARALQVGTVERIWTSKSVPRQNR